MLPHIEFTNDPVPNRHHRKLKERLETEAAILMLEPSGQSVTIHRARANVFNAIARIKRDPEFATRRFIVRRVAANTCKIWRME